MTIQNSLFVLLRRAPHCYTRGVRSHIFILRLHSCSKIIESGSKNVLILRIGLLFRLRIPSIQPKFSNDFTCLFKWHV